MTDRWDGVSDIFEQVRPSSGADMRPSSADPDMMMLCHRERHNQSANYLKNYNENISMSSLSHVVTQPSATGEGHHLHPVTQPSPRRLQGHPVTQPSPRHLFIDTDSEACFEPEMSTQIKSNQINPSNPSHLTSSTSANQNNEPTTTKSTVQERAGSIPIHTPSPSYGYQFMARLHDFANDFANQNSFMMFDVQNNAHYHQQSEIMSEKSIPVEADVASQTTSHNHNINPLEHFDVIPHDAFLGGAPPMLPHPLLSSMQPVGEVNKIAPNKASYGEQYGGSSRKKGSHSNYSGSNSNGRPPWQNNARSSSSKDHNGGYGKGSYSSSYQNGGKGGEGSYSNSWGNNTIGKGENNSYPRKGKGKPDLANGGGKGDKPSSKGGKNGSSNGEESSFSNSYSKSGKNQNNINNIVIDEKFDENNVYAMVTSSQPTSKMVQQQLNDPASRQKVLKQLLPHLPTLLCDRYANYVCSMAFALMSKAEIKTFLEVSCKGSEIAEAAADKRGTHTLQALAQSIADDNNFDAQAVFISHLEKLYVPLMLDPNSTHVVQKCISIFDPTILRASLFKQVLVNFDQLMKHPHGLCVLKVTMTKVAHAEEDAAFRKKIMDKVTQHGWDLIEHPFGNYVIQHALEVWDPLLSLEVIKSFLGSYAALSKGKFSSNVIEKIIDCVGNASTYNQGGHVFNVPKAKILAEITDAMDDLIHSAFGQYVIKRAFAHTANNADMQQAMLVALQNAIPPNNHKLRSKWDYIIVKNSGTSNQQTTIKTQ